MRKIFLYGLLLSAGALSLVSCSDDYNPGGSTMGKINPLISLDTEAVTSKSTPSRSDAQAISVNDLSLRLTPQDGQSSPRVWSSIADFNNNEEFKVGDYLLEAYYGKPGDEGFEAPYYHGSTNLTVNENRVTQVSLEVALANSMVSVTPTEAFTSYFTNPAFVVSTTSGDTHDYAANETRGLYVTPGEVNVYANVTRPDGKSATLLAATFTAAARCHHKVTVDVNAGATGAANLVVTWDETMQSTQEIEIELNDDLFAAALPTVKVTGYDNNATYNYIQGSKPADLAPEILFNAAAGIKSITMTSTSDWLASKGIASSIDLVAADPATYAKLQSLGIEGRYNRVDRFAIIKLADLFNQLGYVEGSTNTSTFTFVVTDKVGKQSDPVSFTATVDKLTAAVTATADMYDGDNKVTLDVDYNGNDFADHISFKFKNDRGTYDVAPYTIISQPSRAAGYKVEVTGLPDAGVVELQMYLDGDKVAEWNVNRVALNINVTANNNDVFATSALVTLTSSDFDTATSEAIDILGSTDGVNYIALNATRQADGKSYKLTGLTPGTSYTIRAILGGNRGKGTLTTEQALQIPNGDMESWGSADKGNNWNNYFLGTDLASSVWGTNNPMTTSQGTDMSYTRATTTKPTNDAHSGSNAAWLRSMGWGSGNTAAGNMSLRVMNYGDAGLLHLGASRSGRPSDATGVAGPISTADLDCGLAFASRPASLSFWYKYSPKNGSDRGLVEFTVYDVEGAALFTTTRNLESAGSYTQVTIPATYAAGAKKAGKIYVKFLSSNSSDYLTKDTKNFTSPSFGNLSDGEYLGSQLFIDDVTLNY